MPDNRNEPTHRSMREVAALEPWSRAIGEAAALRTAILPLQAYYDLLAPQAAQIDVWHTIYQHPVASPAAIVEWVSATGLKPFVEPLNPDLRASYLAEYEKRIAAAYQPRADGKLLLAFPRITALLGAQAGAIVLPVCDHYSGVEVRMRKSLQLQAEMSQEFGTCVFDVTLDCEDGAPVGGEADHA
eukprot:gene12674-15488_t